MVAQLTLTTKHSLMQKIFWSLRSCVFVLWLVVSVIPWAIISLTASIFIRGTPLYWLTTFWLRMAMAGARVICGVQARVTGMHHVEQAQQNNKVIILAKHQSTWETFALPCLMPRPLCYVFKRELLMIPFFGWAMSRLDMIHIDRSKRAQAWERVAIQGKKFMAQGNWTIMFPEGTRTPRGSQGVYKSGGTRLAVATEAHILPIAITSARCWPRKSFMLRPGIIDVSIGKPIPSLHRNPDELIHEVETWIESEMQRLDADAYIIHKNN